MRNMAEAGVSPRSIEHGKTKKTTVEQLRSVMPQIWELVLPRWKLLFAGLVLLIIKSLTGLVLPASTKFLFDNVIAQRQLNLLPPLIGAVIAATLIQAITSFTLTQLLSKEGQRVIAELRRKVQIHISRLPVSYYDSNKSGTLVARIMSDVEGVRNLIGTGQIELISARTSAEVSRPPSLWVACVWSRVITPKNGSRQSLALASSACCKTSYARSPSCR